MIYCLQALITLVGPTQFLVMYYWLTTGFSLYPSFNLNIHCFVLVKQKGMQFQCLSLAPLRLHVLRCLFFFFFLRINGRILFKERINLYKNKAASRRAKENCTSYRAFHSPIKKTAATCKVTSRKAKEKNKTILQLLKTSFHN